MFKKIFTGVIIIIVAAFLYVAYGRKNLTLSKEYVKEKYTLPNSKFINWNGTQLHYTDAGKGFPILMIHGFGGSNWDFKVLDSLLNDKYRIIRVDLPGFGLSDFPPSENPDYIKTYSDYFSFLLDTLHLDSLYVMGNSMGGMMAWNLAVEHPDKVKKLILFNSAGYDVMETLKKTNAKLFRYGIFRLLFNRGIPKFMTQRGVKRVFYDYSKLTDEKITRLNNFWNRDGNLHQIMSMAASDKSLDPKLIQKVACPTLIVWGKEDMIVPVKYADYFHHDIINSREIIYDSCGHVPMLEKPLEVKVDVLKFLSGN